MMQKIITIYQHAKYPMFFAFRINNTMYTSNGNTLEEVHADILRCVPMHYDLSTDYLLTPVSHKEDWTYVGEREVVDVMARSSQRPIY